MFKIKNKIFPVYLTKSITVPNRSGLKSLFFNHSSVYRVKHSFAKCSFSYSGKFLWNSSPSSLTLTKQRYHSLAFFPRSWLFQPNLGILAFCLNILAFILGSF